MQSPHLFSLFYKPFCSEVEEHKKIFFMKPLKKVCVVLIALFCCCIASAEELQDVVYLKNGSVIRGTIIEQIPNESLKIQTSDGNVFAYEMSQIYKFTKEEPALKHRKTKGSSNPRTKGYRGWIETGGAVGLGDYGDGVFAFSTSHGYQFNPYFFLGAGIGVDYHFDWETVFMPIYANARCYFLNNKISPFFDAKIGYSPIDGSGLYFSPSLGVSVGVSKKCALNLLIGYNLQQTKMESYYGYYYGGYYFSSSSESKELLHGISFKLGFEF